MTYWSENLTQHASTIKDSNKVLTFKKYWGELKLCPKMYFAWLVLGQLYYNRMAAILNLSLRPLGGIWIRAKQLFGNLIPIPTTMQSIKICARSAESFGIGVPLLVKICRIFREEKLWPLKSLKGWILGILSDGGILG